MSTAAKVELYISKRPYVKESLARGIINHSALARRIADEKQIRSIDAAKAAISRYQDILESQHVQREEKTRDILQETGLSLQANVSVEKSEEAVEGALVFSRTGSGYTCVVPGGEMALVNLESPEALEQTPGVLEFILSSLAAEDINVAHVISCREDTSLVVAGSDASKTLELLQNRIGKG